MRSFIKAVLEELLTSEENISNSIFILPSKRAGSFLLNELSKLSGKNIFSPSVYSIEEFTENISGLTPVDNTISLFEFYDVYKQLTPKEQLEEFETFTAWAQSLIHDFNEIDRYLIDHKSFFDYLSGIQDVNHWYLQEEKTELINNYLLFWHKLPEYYEGLQERLLSQGKAYQGLIYRKASEHIKEYTAQQDRNHIFLGFNALNTAEQNILQEMLEQEKAEVHWDIDEVFLRDKEHQTSMFINEYLKQWPYYKNSPVFKPGSTYKEEKDIEIIGVPKNIGQAKYLGELLSEFDPEKLKNTAVVLGQEDLLLPVLNSLPNNISQLNITMGFPLKNAPLSSLFDKLFQIHLHSTSGYYYKDVIEVINHPVLHDLLMPYSAQVIGKINKENIVYLKEKELISSFPEKLQPLIMACFESWQNNSQLAIEKLGELIQQIKAKLKESKDSLGLEFLYQFHILFNKLENLNSDYPHIKSIKSLYGFYKEIMATQSLDFQGRPFQGLQLMGMLESRALDFENVIITSLNEGVLPSGKSSNSFIPYDLKKAYNLPTYREKDAVYTYHFYRLLQRAKNVYLLYNTEPDGLNSGEKSRFLTQLEIEKQPAHQLRKKLISPSVPAVTGKLKEVAKTPEIMEKLKSLAESGFSPSALTTYIRNPLDFYYQYVLGVREQDEVEETVAYNTLGTVIHDSLENFYKPLEGKLLTETDVKGFLKQVPEEIASQFAKSYTKAPMDRGKNLLIFEVAKRYLKNFLELELERLKNGEKVEILQIETGLKEEISVEELDFRVYLRGKVDRVENANGITRIIDYKTGKVGQNQIEIVDWDSISTDYDKYSKSFQVLTYTSMISKKVKLPAEAGIISFKNLKGGFLKFTKKDKPGHTKNKITEIDTEMLGDFQAELKKLIAEICDPEVAFCEKDLKKTYGNY
ncbi:PD-(D/E)XK nuclease family protein [Salegentibacter chungangensis]|uniref:PD-(D/E)XK nuclease family protein n=1 Tax=Salegentibacter chungangensis TaxID=1335724 RepID=A0ABW3NM11_9FLAO